jgi:N-acetylmuramoyl-L-alanine amidase
MQLSAPTRGLEASASAVGTPNREPARARHIVVVDAGHGGRDNGMSGPLGSARKTLSEKQITLAVARRVGAILQARGIGVVYTRTTDTLIALADRGRIANEANGNLFLSIHVNAANPAWNNAGGARGFETYFLAEAKTQDERRVEEMENASVAFEDTPRLDRGDPLNFILADMKQNEHLRESSQLAAVVQRQLQTIHPGPNRGVKQAGFSVLVHAFMPAVLVELGFGTNPREAEFLMDPREQDRMATAIATAAIEYLDRYDRRVAGPRP